MLEHLCSKHDALSSNPTIQYHPKKKKEIWFWKIGKFLLWQKQTKNSQ
jgi:hypothetical protein